MFGRMAWCTSLHSCTIVCTAVYVEDWFFVVRRLYAGVADWFPVQIEPMKLSLSLARCKEVNLY